MNLTILGCYAATPRTFTNPTAQVLEINNRLFLILYYVSHDVIINDT
jgi:ribonuclease Z